MSKEEVLLLFSPILVFLSILFTHFLEQGIISRQKFWSRVKFFFSWAHSCTNLGQVPLPPGVRVHSCFSTGVPKRESEVLRNS